MSGPYEMDFMETIVDVHFGDNAFVLITVEATARVDGTTPPPCPSVVLNLGAGEKLVDQRVSCVKKVTPAKPGVDKIFFIWSPIAPFPTLSNYQVIMPAFLIPPVQYHQQFARVIQFDGGGFVPPENYGIPGGSFTGDFPSLAAAQAYAVTWNNNTLPFRTTERYLLSDGVNLSSPIAVSAVAGRELDVPVVTPAFSTSTLTAQYLISVPSKFTHMNPLVTVGAGNSSQLTANGYAKVALTTVAKALAATPDTTATATQTGTGSYDVTSVVVAHVNTVTVTGGVGGPG